ncbi:MAG: FecR family protein [Steroidobacteraceae bacterium]
MTTTKVCMEHAIRVWTRRYSGTWLESDETELQAWLAAASENREAYEKVARAWSVAGSLKRPGIADQPASSVELTASASGGRMDVPATGEQHRGFSPRRRIALAACAAVLLVAMAAPLWRIGTHWWNGPEVHLSTSKGKPASFVLDDGTKVLLDADSEATASIGAHARRLLLTRGEALVTVTHDAWRSFEVVAGAGRIRDLGTQFDVDVLGGTTRISVLQGRVEVLTSRSDALLVAGQVGGYDGNGTLLMQRPLDATATRWSTGQRHFEDERLADVLVRLTRYHSVTFMLSDDGLRDLRVSGTFRTGDLGLFLRTLSAALPIDVRYLDQEHVEITRRAPARTSPNQRTNDRR